MNLVDSSGWLEYFADGPNAGFFAAPLEKGIMPYIRLIAAKIKRTMSIITFLSRIKVGLNPFLIALLERKINIDRHTGS